MKKLTKKVIEAGFVPPNALEQMKQWGAVDDDAAEAVPEEATPEAAASVVAEVKELLDTADEIPEVKESILDADKLIRLQGQVVRVLADTRPEPTEFEIATVKDQMGNFLFAYDSKTVELIARRGTRILWNGAEYDVIEVRPSYMGDQIKYYVCGVQSVPDHAKMLHVP